MYDATSGRYDEGARRLAQEVELRTSARTLPSTQEKIKVQVSQLESSTNLHQFLHECGALSDVWDLEHLMCARSDAIVRWA